MNDNLPGVSVPPAAGRDTPPGPGLGVAARVQPAVLDQSFDGDSLYAVRAAVAAHASAAGMPERRIRDVVLAVHELAANAVRHGAGQGRVRLWITGDGIRCEVTDAGAPPARRRRPPKGPAPATPRHGRSSTATGCGWSGRSPTRPAWTPDRPARSPP